MVPLMCTHIFTTIACAGFEGGLIKVKLIVQTSLGCRHRHSVENKKRGGFLIRWA